MLKLVGALALGIFSAFYLGFGATILWGWFMVPLGLPVITVQQMAGVMATLAFFKVKTPEKDKEVDLIYNTVMIVLALPLLLAMGFVVKVLGTVSF